jgi:hypothetical protein
VAAWQASAGATLLMPSGEGDHLFVVLNDPAIFVGYGARPHLVLVSLSTVRPGIPHDPTCVLQPGCHPFVKHESYVLYRRARIDPVAHVQKLVAQGLFKPQDPVSPEILAAIKAGLLASPFTKGEFKQLNI